MKYTVVCKIKSGDIMAYYTSSFSVAMNYAEIFLSINYVASVVITNTLTGTTTKYIF